MRAIALAVLTLAVAAPLNAQGFRASLVKPASTARAVARETLWNCAGTECRAPRSGTSSDMTECRAAARKLGRLSGFTAGDKSFAAADLERCNTAAAAN